MVVRPIEKARLACLILTTVSAVQAVMASASIGTTSVSGADGLSVASLGPRACFSPFLTSAAHCSDLPGIHAEPFAPTSMSVTVPDGLARYDIRFEPGADSRTAAGLLDVETRLGKGTASTTFLGRSLHASEQAVRLETAWTPRQAGAPATLRIGDAITRGGAWGRAVRFGGLQWGTSYGAPSEASGYPLVASAGEAVVPSAFDLYLDEATRLSHAMSTGASAIAADRSLIGGAGLQPVIRDLLGRTRVVALPSFAGGGLLPAGQSVSSYEGGFVREEFGIASNRYGRGFAAGTRNVGFSDRLSGELRGELLGRRYTLGTGATWRWPVIGTANIATAASKSEFGPGVLLSLGLEQQSRYFGYGIRTRMYTPRFSQLGLAESQPAPRSSSLARVGVSPTGRDSLSLSYALQDERAQEQTQLLTLGYTINRWTEKRISLVALKSLSGSETAYSLGVTFIQALGGRINSGVDGFPRR